MSALEFLSCETKNLACDCFLHFALFVGWLSGAVPSNAIRRVLLLRRLIPRIGGRPCQKKARLPGKFCRRKGELAKLSFQNAMNWDCFRILPPLRSSFMVSVTRVSKGFGK